MIYEILDKEGKVQNTIIAELDFVEKYYPGQYRDVTPLLSLVVEIAAEPEVSNKELETLLIVMGADVAKIKKKIGVVD